jgi:glycosyltransferase involved in cell wall biosynthesis
MSVSIKDTLSCAIITPIGPGHQEVYVSMCVPSINLAISHGKGPFEKIECIPVFDLEGSIGRSEARNIGVELAWKEQYDWIFFLDADDLLFDGVFEAVQEYIKGFDAVWGQIVLTQYPDFESLNFRENEIKVIDNFKTLIAHDPCLTLQMGHFVRTKVARKHPFDVGMNAGEDFKYYLEIWKKHRCLKCESAFFINVEGNHSSGPRSADSLQWRFAVDREILEARRHLADNKDNLELTLDIFNPSKGLKHIPKKPDFSLVEQIAPELESDAIFGLIASVQHNLNLITVHQLAFCLQLITFKSNFRDQSFNLLASFIRNQSLHELGMVLQLENYLASTILKKFENEESYCAFYSIFDEFHKLNPVGPKKTINVDANGVLFFVHQPSFLAHTNPMFQLLKSKPYSSRVTVASLESNDSFKEKCNQLGCEFIVLEGTSTLHKLIHLERCAAEHNHVVWQCLPVYLSFFSKRLPNINWWSVKFHPSISGLQKCITGTHSGENIQIGTNYWHTFSPPFEMKNANKKPSNWTKRRGVIAAFCREELIDDEKYWAVLSHLLNSRKLLSFHYCGRRPIHERWVEKFGIKPSQVVFLGWLPQPEKHILKVALILDTYGQPHGLMGREAAIAGVPMIFPIREAKPTGPEVVYAALSPDSNIQNPAEYSSFTTNDTALSLVDELAFKSSANKATGLRQKELINSMTNNMKFNDLVKLLN